MELEKAFSGSKAECLGLNQQIDQLKGQLRIAQMAIKSRGSSIVEYSSLKENYDRLQHQVEEFKKANKQLMDRLSETKKERANLRLENQDETRSKLEAAMKMAIHHKKEAEMMKNRVLLLQKQEFLLKKEVQRLQLELGNKVA